MTRVVTEWTFKDLAFVIQTLIPERADHAHVAGLLQEDNELLEAMLEDDRLFRSLMDDDEAFVCVSPHLFFRVLLLRALRDLEREVYTIERRNLHKVILFDARQVVELLAQPDVCNYLAGVLASFTRLQSRSIPVRLRDGHWHQIRVNDLDIDSLLRYAQFVDEDRRFPIYQRVADACLFLTGVFPEYIDTRYRYPTGSTPRIRLRATLVHSYEDHENYGRTFYGLAAKHKDARDSNLDRVLARLSDQFVLAEKPLAFITQRYLALRKHGIFEL
jgi:hypothetical protein